MARANLPISPDLVNCFLAAQDGPVNRLIKVVINNETLILGEIKYRVHDCHRDFDDLLVPCLLDTEACLVLYCLSEEQSTSREWLLFSWVPDGISVRSKMLYSSSREDLKRSLGVGFFTAEYFANVRSEVSWIFFSEYRAKDRIDGPLTETERIINEERALSHQESNQIKSNAMGVLPFKLNPDATVALNEFSSGLHNFVELKLENESINLLQAATINMKENLQSRIHPDDARFLALRMQRYAGDDLTVFLFSCPDSAPVRTKMIMSSAKATVLSNIGIKFDRTMEIRGADEIEDQIWTEGDPSSSTSSSSSSSAATLSHAKPTRPGRGKAKLIVSK